MLACYPPRVGTLARRLRNMTILEILLSLQKLPIFALRAVVQAENREKVLKAH